MIIKFLERDVYELFKERNYTWLWKSVVYLMPITGISSTINKLLLQAYKRVYLS